MAEEIFPWLKSLPLAPEYHPTLSEFQDPISYISKIEEEASRYGICKIIPPVHASPKKTIYSNLNQSLSRENPDSSPTFTTRHQQIGFSPRKYQRPVERHVWESGVYYTPSQFKHKAKEFEKSHFKKVLIQKKVSSYNFTPLKLETMFWKAQFDKPFTVEYGNDLVGSAFDETDGGRRQGKKACDVMTVGESEWNMRKISRAHGSLLRFLKEEIPGVTSPMLYLGMLYSWFAWHVEDHDFHSLNYMHFGGGKIWYGVPMEAAFAFEDLVRMEGYGGEISPTVTFATLGGKTTIMSPEVLLKAGVPCCRLVQNPGEFVVTFPRAYHSGFNLGFNCAEATNFATPRWLRIARESATRRVSADLALMFSESQLLYDLAISLSLSKQTSCRPEPLSSRLKQRLQIDGYAFVQRTFMQDVMRNNELLHALGNGSPVTLLSEDVLKSLATHCLNLKGGVDDDRRSKKILYCSYDQPNQNVDPASLFSCVTCGSPCYSCVAIVQPSLATVRYFMCNEDVNVMDPGSTSGKLPKSSYKTKEPKDSPAALDLLALAYGDSSDSEEASESTKLVIGSNRSLGRYEYGTEVSSANKKPSINGSGPLVSPCQRDSSRMHVFCLEHALEVEQRLRRYGGVNVLLLCHQDYQEMNDAARLVGKELGISEDMWTDVRYIDTTKQDKELIQWALEQEVTATGNQDWAVRLGIDIFHSAELGTSPPYKKQMPYNSVIYRTFRQLSPFNDVLTPKQSRKQKKSFVAGRWCGKVWMSSQVHPLLALRNNDDDDDSDDDDDDDRQQEDHEAVSKFPKKNVKHGKQLAAVTKSKLKRKRAVKGNCSEVVDDVGKKPQELIIISSDESDCNTAESRTNKRRVLWQKNSTARKINDKKGQGSGVDSSTRSFKGNIVCKHARKLEVGTNSKPKKNQNLSKKGKEACVVVTSDDDEGIFGGHIRYVYMDDHHMKE